MDTLNIQTIPCPLCGAELVLSSILDLKQGASGNGELNFHVELVDAAIVGGCEHAAELREAMEGT